MNVSTAYTTPCQRPQIQPSKTSDVRKGPGGGLRRRVLIIAVFISTGAYFAINAATLRFADYSLDSRVMLAMIGVPSALLMFDCLFCYMCCEDAGDSCPLCQYRVRGANWNNGKHRAECYRLNSAIIARFQTLYPDVKCPTCSRALPVWPADACEKFYCSGCPLVTPGGIQNNGCNLFRCFPCNYDLCLNCVTKRAQSREQQRVNQQRRELRQEIDNLKEEARELREARALIHQSVEGPPPSYEEIEGSSAPKLDPKQDLP